MLISLKEEHNEKIDAPGDVTIEIEQANSSWPRRRGESAQRHEAAMLASTFRARIDELAYATFMTIAPHFGPPDRAFAINLARALPPATQRPTVHIIAYNGSTQCTARARLRAHQDKTSLPFSDARGPRLHDKGRRLFGCAARVGRLHRFPTATPEARRVTARPRSRVKRRGS